eukprot:403371029
MQSDLKSHNEDSGLQKIFSLLNYLDFCVLPRVTSSSQTYYEMYKRFYKNTQKQGFKAYKVQQIEEHLGRLDNLNLYCKSDCIDKSLSSQQTKYSSSSNLNTNLQILYKNQSTLLEGNLNNEQKIVLRTESHDESLTQNQKWLSYQYYNFKIYNKRQNLSIPLILHKVWVTSPSNPRELTELIEKPVLEKLIKNSQSILNQSTKSIKGSFQYIFWTNDKEPQTVNLFENLGYEVRELHELRNYEKVYQQMENYFLEDSSGVGVFADIARMIITQEMGGIYQDIEGDLWGEYSVEAHYLFDFFGYLDENNGEYGLTNWGFGTKPNHPFHKAYLDNIKKYFLMSGSDRPFFLNRCLFKTAGVTMYFTGPFFMTVIGEQYLNQSPDSQDIIIYSIQENQVKVRDSFDKISEVPISLKFTQQGVGSWTNDYQDNLIFGWQNQL